MGPQLYSCGNPYLMRGLFLLVIWLQWGHNFTVVEIVCPKTFCHIVALLQWGHNFTVVEIVSLLFYYK